MVGDGRPVEVWTDGSCKFAVRSGRVEPLPGELGFGGWAALLVTDGDSLLVSGCEPDVRNVEMEIAAVTGGLHELPDGTSVCVRTDCMTSVWMYGQWCNGVLGSYTGPLAKRAAVLARELDRLQVTVLFLEPRDRGSQHRRVHKAAGAQAADCRDSFAGTPAASLRPARERPRELPAKLPRFAT